MSKTKVFAEEMFNYAKFPEIEKIKLLETELALLRKVADAARAYLNCGCNETLDGLVLTVLELDKEGER